MATMLLVYFVMACWAAGTSIASGVVVPMLLIGGIYGRMVGCLLVDQFGIQTSKYWAWMDPGAFALLGSVSFFAGVTRLTMSLTVIMVEITNDIHQLLLIMITIMVAKWTGDFLSHPLYHALLEFKCIPFLGSEPMLIKSDGSILNLVSSSNFFCSTLKRHVFYRYSFNFSNAYYFNSKMWIKGVHQINVGEVMLFF